ncbi:MAG TPA: peroxiredoxin [Xanthobacteraceae bacterium]|nr:peroxiredoxin [Xanthobacteraceae bacterium]
MALQIGDNAPDFEADTTAGRIRFHDWMDGQWTVLFSHPKDFTPVCTTELGVLAHMEHEFEKRGVKLIELSIDSVADHAKWSVDIEESQGRAPTFPMIGDHDLSIAKLWGMLPAAASGDASKRTASDNQTVRNVFVIGPDRKIKLILVYPMNTGRNFDEVLRVIDSLQLTARHKVATPANWKQGDDVLIQGSVSEADARIAFPQGWKASKSYVRVVAQPH